MKEEQIRKEVEESGRLMSSRLISERSRRDYTLEEAGTIAGVSKSTYRKWEKGIIARVSTLYIKRLADHYQVNPTWLMGYDTRREVDSPEVARARNEVSDILGKLDEEKFKALKVFIDEFIKK